MLTEIHFDFHVDQPTSNNIQHSDQNLLVFCKIMGNICNLKSLKLKKHVEVEYYYHSAESVLVLILKKKFLTWLKVSHEESKLDNMLPFYAFSLEPKAFPQLFCCELQNAIEK